MSNKGDSKNNLKGGEMSEFVTECWCGPCKMMAPVIDEVAKEYKDRCKFVKLNVEDNQTVASQLGIMNIPTFIFFKGGKEVSRFSGAVPKQEFIKRVETVIGA
jgi:thioredoxin